MSRKELRMEWENEALVSQFRKRTELLSALFHCTGPFAFDAAFLCADRLP